VRVTRSRLGAIGPLAAIGWGRAWRCSLIALAPALATTACGGQTTIERHLVFVRITAPVRATIWIADADGGHAHRLTRGFSARVAPDGRTIAVARPHGIYLVDSDGKRERRLSSTKMWPEAWTRDGRWLVATTDSTLVAVEVRSGQRHLLARGPILGISLAPSGQRVVYAHAPRATPDAPCGTHSDLYSVALTGTGRLRLTHDGLSESPVWGATRIAFSRVSTRRFPGCLAAGVWTIAPDGTRLRAVLPRPPLSLSRHGYYGLEPVAWLSARELLVAVRSEWGGEAARLDLGGRLRRLTFFTRRSGHRVRQVFYIDKAARDGRLAIGGGGDEQVTISIIRTSDGRPLFVHRGTLCCPDWNR